ncbi:hypothetical protein EXIGLDRAFT_723197 [Exidia glandulosa HHB12029]|uniref:F-box protein Hrt3/FBXO9 C-terminal domain-containing protein n=1 Tax=Exidia glandulosa HHB12029 TaxID=1314781 RepID=A0A165N0V3_EXIGL|nr:hypothetical protein EXIGLDRAFT_723197 [Exidia glandulosa HHB12029]
MSVSELDAFREQWLAEVRQRTHGLAPVPDAAASTSTSSPRPPEPPLGPRLQSSLDFYRLAVDMEQRGKLDDALALYRRAFRMDAHVDKLYHKFSLAEQRLNQHVQTEKPTEPPKATGDEPSEPTPISTIIESLQQSEEPLAFAPEDESAPVPLALMPDELLIHTVLLLALQGDIATVERLALVNRKLRLLTLDATIWRSLVQLVHVPPQVPDQLELVRRYKYDYRRVWIECPRVRLDGTYISVCHYVRHGVSDNPWHHPQLLITYHRYLRFFPDGQVIMLLSNGDSPPRETVHILTPSLRMEGVSVGKWSVNGAVVQVTDLIPVQGKQMRYSFSMTLVLKSKPLGRWNKLDFVEYSSVHLETGEVEPLPMRNERPFHFSKVRRYGLGVTFEEDDAEQARLLAAMKQLQV